MYQLNEPQWLLWAKKLHEIAQNGLHYTKDVYDRERFETVRDVAVEIMAHHADIEPDYVSNLFANEVGHATPKVDVRGVAFRNDKILLVKERSDGLWTLPGGWADVNEAPSVAIEREIFEESGFQVKAVKLLALYDRSKHPHPPHPFHIYKACFLCEITGGEASTSHETSDVGFFAENQLPPLSIGRVTSGQIERFFEHYRDPDLATDFD
ncbi:NUDIX hydrolase [Chloroflexi bacterium TSY]|nr:NUDIX hydrolase [Chloroflexi bacterium TSY]